MAAHKKKMCFPYLVNHLLLISKMHAKLGENLLKCICDSSQCNKNDLILSSACPDKLWRIKDVTLCAGNQTSHGHNTNLSLNASQLHNLW